MNTIDTLNRWSEAWAGYMGIHFRETAVAFLVIAALWMLLHKRLSPQVGYGLFLLILLKCLIPIPVSLPSYLHYLSPQQALVYAGKWTEGAPSQRFETAVEPNLVPEPTGGSLQQFIPNSNPAPTVPETKEAKSALLLSSHSIRRPSLITLGMLTWAAAVLFFLGRLVWMQWRYAQIIQTMRTIDPQTLPLDWEELKSRLRLRRPVRLVSCPAITIPAISGVVRSHLIIPPDFFQSFSSHQARWILLHELAHVQRLDTLVALIQKIVQSVFFFNPVIWLTNWMIDQQREYACDDIALATCGAPRLDCGQGFLSLALRNSHRPSFAVGALGLFNHNTLVRRRMMRILDSKRKLYRGLSTGAIVLLLLAAFLVLPSVRSEDGQSDSNAISAMDQKPFTSDGTVQKATGEKKNPPPDTMLLRLIDKSDSQNPSFHNLSPVSRDGKSIVYSRAQELKIRDIAMGTNRTIPNLTVEEDEMIWSPLLSPENTKLCYCKWSNKKKITELHLIGLDGSGDRIFFKQKQNEDEDFYMMGYTPDNQKILAAFITGEGNPNSQILLISINDGSVKVVKNTGKQPPSNACISPDGKFIAFDLPKTNNTADSDIYLIAVDGSSETLLFQSPANEKLLGWSPDGQWIFFSTNSSRGVDAYIQNMENGKPKGQPTLVKKDIGNLEPKGFTQDGSFYYVIKYTTGGIYQLRFDFQKGQCLSPPNPLCMGVPPTDISWSPDGKYFAYYENNDAAGSQRQSLCIMQEETGETRRFALPSNDLYDLHWSPDSKSILSESWGSKGLYQVDVQTGKAEMLIKNASGNVQYAQYLPDGKHIVSYSADIDLENFNRKNAWFAIRNLETGEENKIVSDPYLSWFFAVSPDGKWLAFSIDDPTNRETDILKVISIPDGETKMVWDKYPGQRFGYSPNLVWTTDNSSLLYLEGRNLMQISISGGEPKKLYQLDSAWSGKLTVHPDGQRIAFVEGGDIKEIWALDNFLSHINNLTPIFTKERDSFIEVSQNPTLNPSLRITDQRVTDNFEDAAMNGWEISEDPKKGPPFEHKVEHGKLALENSRACIGLTEWKNYRIKVRYCPQAVGDSIGGGNGVVFFRRTATDSYGFHCFPKVNMVQLVAGHKEPTGASNINVLNTAQDIHFELNQWYNLEMEIMGDHMKGYVDGKLVFDVTDDQSSNGSIALKANDQASFDDFSLELLP